MRAPKAYQHLFTDLAHRLGVPDALTSTPEGEDGEGRILVWIDEQAYRTIVRIGEDLRANRKGAY